VFGKGRWRGRGKKRNRGDRGGPHTLTSRGHAREHSSFERVLVSIYPTRIPWEERGGGGGKEGKKKYYHYEKRRTNLRQMDGRVTRCLCSGCGTCVNFFLALPAT